MLTWIRVPSLEGEEKDIRSIIVGVLLVTENSEIIGDILRL